MIINGRLIAQNKEEELKKECQKLKKKGVIPWCVTFVSREDPEGNLYTQTKAKVCQRVGVKFTPVSFSFKTAKVSPVLRQIKTAADNPQVSGIMIQKPSQRALKKVISVQNFINYWSSLTSLIPEKKDIDCLSPVSLGKIMQKKYYFLPATVAAIWDILQELGSNISDANITVLGFSEIIGKPLAVTLRDSGATVILAGSRTKDLAQFTKNSDIIISCVGKPKLITREMVNPQTVIIDAGTTKVGHKISGDVDFENIKGIARAITPVPGGVGPLTVINLVKNIIQSATL